MKNRFIIFLILLCSALIFVSCNNEKRSRQAFVKATNSYARNELNETIQSLKKAVEINPQYPIAYAYLGKAYAEKGLYGIALSNLQLALRLSPSNRIALITRGKLYLETDYYYLAEDDFEMVLDKWPYYTQALSGIGEANYLQGDFATAVSHYNKLGMTNTLSSNDYYYRGMSYYYLEEYSKAANDMSRYIALAPDDPNGYGNRALAYMELERYYDAIIDLSELIDLKPRSSTAYESRGLSYIALDKPVLALKDFEKVLELRPDYAEGYYNCGLAYYQLGLSYKAKASWKSAVDLGYRDARIALGTYYNELY